MNRNYLPLCLVILAISKICAESEVPGNNPESERRSRSYTLTCPFPYEKIGDQCLYSFCSESEDFEYSEARAECLNTAQGGDLAIFTDANQFNNIQNYLSVIDPNNLCSYWLAGTDEDVEGVWKWETTGGLVPRGVPFWATHSSGNTLLPFEDNGENNLIISKDNNNLLVDRNECENCGEDIMPLCQYTPPAKEHHPTGHYPQIAYPQIQIAYPQIVYPQIGYPQIYFPHAHFPY